MQVLKQIALLVMLVVLAAGAVPLQAQGDGAGQLVLIEMPDGVKLAGTLYLPEGDGPWPVLLVRTPYGRDEMDGMAHDLAGVGIATLTQDMRGRYESEGTFTMFFSDQSDGHVTLDWILVQPWSDGRVATFGGSALGITQYMLAPGAPEALRCQWIEVATPDLYGRAVYHNGAYRAALVDGWLADLGETHLIEPLRVHPLDGPYWDPVQLDGRYDEVNVRAVHVGGWYDIFARGTIDGFLGYQQGGPGAAGLQHLIMGPWTHDTNNPQVGELTVPNAVLAEREELMFLWLDACLLDGAGGVGTLEALDAAPAVTYFTLGAVDEPGAPGNQWRSAETWPPPGGADVPLYLHPNNYLDVEPPGEDSGGDTFAYDPADPSPTICGANLGLPAGACDQRSIERREDVVVYSTVPLPEPVEITGDLRADLWITTDVPGTDLVVRITDVYPDGRSMLVLDSVMRARYHANPDFTAAQQLTPGEPVRLQFDLGPHSIVFNAGHRIRVSITSSNAPRFAPNPNTGALFLAEGESGQVAHTTILHDAAHPSAIILPVY